MSITRFMIATAVAVRSTTPSTVGRSCPLAPVYASHPRPWMLKSDSVMIAPPTSSATSSPNSVTIGVRLARRPCLRITVRSGRPLARAVRM
jgi:hypothetical protein